MVSLVFLQFLQKKERKNLIGFTMLQSHSKECLINVLSETIPTHEYESKVLTKAFEEITGIKVNHQLLGEGDVVHGCTNTNANWNVSTCTMPISMTQI